MDLGVPVVLVFLGFLNATEMSDKGHPFCDDADWEACVKAHAKHRVPKGMWELRVAGDEWSRLLWRAS